MKDRLKEPSTWGGFGMLLMALNQIFDINEAGAVGEAVTQAAQTGDMNITIAAGVAALAAIFMKEKRS